MRLRLLPLVLLWPLATAAQTPEGSYAGTVPMAGASGSAWHLDLWADGSFHLSRGAEGARIGRWVAGEGVIALHDGSDPPLRLGIGDAGLTLRDMAGDPIAGDAGGTLAPLDGLQPATISLPIAGMVTYMADAAIIRECLTGRAYPIALEADWISLERALLAAGRGGVSTLATMEATIAHRAGMERPARPTVTVDRFDSLLPGGTCAERLPDAPLRDTRWMLTSLPGHDLSAMETRRAPHLVLRAGDAPRLTATAGCNTISGSYDLGAEALTLGPLAMTRMACPPPLDGVERDFLAALQATRAARITGHRLDLVDADGTVRATFEADALP